MSAPIIAFFNNKGGVGKTSLVYHLAWMYAHQGKRVLTVDLDPQSNLTSIFLSEEDLEENWEDESQSNTIYRCVKPLIKGISDVSEPHLMQVELQVSLPPHLMQVELNDIQVSLLMGDLALSQFEDELATVWPKCADQDERSFRVMSAFWRVIQSGISNCKADLVLIDMGPNLGAINRAIMIATDYLVIPLAPDLFSVQGLKNLGPTLKKWKGQWEDRRSKKVSQEFEIPEGNMQPVGYVTMLHAERASRPTKAYQRWLDQIPKVYQTEILGLDELPLPIPLGSVKHYRSLMPMAQEARKPIFFLKPADGVVGGHYYSVKSAYDDFKLLSENILKSVKNQSQQ